jgi:phosphatidylglycerophosphate synthase
VSGRRLSPATSLGSFFRDADALRRKSERSPGLFWTRRVNRRVGAMIALVLLHTPATPNMVSIAGLVVHVAGAVLVVASPPPAPVPLAILLFLTWELAFSLDCADGQLARARGAASPFGAWLDQIVDFLNHTAVVGSLVAFTVRAFRPNSVDASVLATLVLAGLLIGLFASAQRKALLGTRPALEPGAHARFRVLSLGRHLTDYGAFLALSSIGLLWPPLLLAALVLTPAFIVASVVVQVAINWPRAGGVGNDSS